MFGLRIKVFMFIENMSFDLAERFIVLKSPWVLIAY